MVWCEVVVVRRVVVAVGENGQGGMGTMGEAGVGSVLLAPPNIFL